MRNIFTKKKKSEAEIIASIRNEFVTMGKDLSDLSDEEIKETIVHMCQTIRSITPTSEQVIRIMKTMGKFSVIEL